VHAFSADDADDADAGGAPACAGEVTTSSMQIGSRALTTVLLSGDLRAVGLGREARGTLDMAAETISWSRGAAGGANVTWIVHARAIETNQLESLVGTEVSDLDRLSSAQLKVAMLFSAFDKDGDGVLSLPEFQALDAATEEEPQEMTSETFAQIIHIVHSVVRQMEGGDGGDEEEEEEEEDEVEEVEEVGKEELGRGETWEVAREKATAAAAAGGKPQGMDLADLTCIYEGPVAETFGTDLNGDFAAVFPTEAKAAMIFDTFDADQDGFWNEDEMCAFMSGMERDVALEWYQSAAADGWIQLKQEEDEGGAAAAAKGARGLRLTLGDLLRLYIASDGSEGERRPPLAADLEEDFEVCGERILLSGQ
jgi:Ca2+-binding EF-hand superfamily protein